MYYLSKIINLFCSNSVPKLTPGYGTDYYFHFPSILAKSNDLILLKVQKTCFFSYLSLLSIFLYTKTQRTLMISSTYMADQKILVSNQATGFAVITCELEMCGSSFFSLFFILSYFQ